MIEEQTLAVAAQAATNAADAFLDTYLTALTPQQRDAVAAFKASGGAPTLSFRWLDGGRVELLLQMTFEDGEKPITLLALTQIRTSIGPADDQMN